MVTMPPAHLSVPLPLGWDRPDQDSDARASKGGKGPGELEGAMEGDIAGSDPNCR